MLFPTIHSPHPLHFHSGRAFPAVQAEALIQGLFLETLVKNKPAIPPYFTLEVCSPCHITLQREFRLNSKWSTFFRLCAKELGFIIWLKALYQHDSNLWFYYEMNHGSQQPIIAKLILWEDYCQITDNWSSSLHHYSLQSITNIFPFREASLDPSQVLDFFMFSELIFDHSLKERLLGRTITFVV